MCRRLLLALFLIPLWLRPAEAEIPVDVELILAVDCSASVNDEEFALQVAGMADAFRDPKVHQAIEAGEEGAVGISVIQWSSEQFQSVAVEWRLLKSAESAYALADEIEAMPRIFGTGATSIGRALLFAADTFEENGLGGARRVIDMSADGENNQGLELEIAREEVVGRGITINGLAIRNEFPHLHVYFEDHVIGGSLAFAEVAKDYEDYRYAILRKLIRELRDVPVAEAPVPDQSWKEARLSRRP